MGILNAVCFSQVSGQDSVPDNLFIHVDNFGGARLKLVPSSLCSLNSSFWRCQHGILLDWLWRLGIGRKPYWDGYLTLRLGLVSAAGGRNIYGLLCGVSDQHVPCLHETIGWDHLPIEVWYHWCANDTQLYLSTSGWLSVAVTVLSQYMKAVWTWRRRNCLQLNPTKIKLGSPRSGYLPFLLLGGPQSGSLLFSI